MKERLLPYVSEEVSEVLSKEFIETPGDQYTRKIFERLQSENPKIVHFVLEASMGSSDPMRVLHIGLLVYRLIESQAQADEMKREFQDVFQ